MDQNAPQTPNSAPEQQPDQPAPDNIPVAPEVPGQAQAPDGGPEVVDIDEGRLMAALSYVGVLVFVPLLTAKDDEFAQYHVKQGLVILGGFIIAIIAAYWYSPFGSTLFLLLLIADIIAIVQTLQGKRWKIPGIGHIAEQFNI